MANFIIINAGATELTNVNAGGDDVAAGTISAPITLTGTELLVVAATDKVAVMQTGASDAEKQAVAELLAADLDLEVVDVSADVALIELDGSTAAATMTAQEVADALAGGNILLAVADNDEAKRKLAKILTHGVMPDEVDS